MSEEKAKQLLAKYLSGEANAEEHDLVEAWYGKLNTDQEKLTDLRKDAIREVMLQNIKVAVTNKKAKKTFFIGSWIKMAAAILLFASVTFSLWKLNTSHENKSTQITASTKAGEQKKLVLSDGSEIILSPLAKITYPEKFNADSREISLTEGEAFFTIAHEENRPFHVHLPAHLKVTVLGTSFRVRADRAKDNVEIAVATGKVAIRKKSMLLGTLVRNEKLQFNKVTGLSTFHAVRNLAPVEIKFSGATLAQVIQRMQYIYNIKIQLHETSFVNLKTTATFSSAQKPEEILDIICRLHHLRFSSDQHHHTFKIYK